MISQKEQTRKIFVRFVSNSKSTQLIYTKDEHVSIVRWLFY